MYINIHTFICTFISLYMYIYKPVNVYFHYMQILSQCLGHPRTFISRWILEPAQPSTDTKGSLHISSLSQLTRP